MVEEFLTPELITSIIAIILAVGFGGFWLRIKTKLSAFRILVDSIDDAVADNDVTEAEFKKIWDSAKALLSNG